MKAAIVFATYLTLAWSYHDSIWLPSTHSTVVPFTREIPWIDATELPVNVAHNFIRKFGFVKPSDDDIRDYANTVGITDMDITSALRALYTDPAMVLLEGDDDKIVAYYADTGVNLMNAYPETQATFKSLLDASNAVALVYKPERFLHPLERKAVASRFFFPKNFRMRDIDYDYLDNVPVVDAPVVIRKLVLPTYYHRSRAPYPMFDINKIPYAYKSPVYLRLSDTASSLWHKAIDSDLFPVKADWEAYPAMKTAHVYPSDSYPLYGNGWHCHWKPWLCSGLTRVPTDLGVSAPIVKTLPYEPDTEIPYYRVLGTSVPTEKYYYPPLRGADKDYVNTVPIYTDPWTTLKYGPITEPRLLNTIPSIAPVAPKSVVPLVASKSIPYVQSSYINVPVKDDFVVKSYPTVNSITASDADTTVVPPPYVIQPGHLKAATVPVLTAGEPTITNSVINSPMPSIVPTSFF